MKKKLGNNKLKLIILSLCILSLALFTMLKYNAKAYNKEDVTGEAIVTISSYEKESISTYIGYGYNVVKKNYINADDVSKTNTIFNLIDKNTENGMQNGIRNTNVIVDSASNDVGTSYINARSVEAFISEFNAKFAYKTNVTASDKWLPFSAGIAAEASSSFSNNKSTQKKSEYVKDIREVKTGSVVWTLDESEFYQYLSENFKKDILSMEPEELFNKYGTHFLRSVVLGGRLELNASIEADSSENLTKAVSKFKTSIDASMDSSKKEQGDNKADNKTDNKSEDDLKGKVESESELNLSIQEILKSATVDVSSSCYGGEAKDFTSYINTTVRSMFGADNNLGTEIMGGNTSLGTAYSQWLSTVRTRPALVNVYDEDSLYPIWNLLDFFAENDELLDQEELMKRKAQLQEAFDKYGKENYDAIMGNLNDEKNNSLYATMKTELIGIKDCYSYNRNNKLSATNAAIHEGYKLGEVLVTNAANVEEDIMISNSDSMKIMYKLNEDPKYLPIGNSNYKNHRINYDISNLGAINGYGDVIDKWMVKKGAYYVQIIYKDQSTDSAYNNNLLDGASKNDSIELYETDPVKVDEHGGIDKINVIVLYETIANDKQGMPNYFNWLDEGSVSFK